MQEQEQAMRMDTVNNMCLVYHTNGVSIDTKFADMRKPLKRDKKRETIREDGENIVVNPEDLDSWR